MDSGGSAQGLGNDRSTRQRRLSIRPTSSSSFYADPFLFEHQGRMFLFFENCRRSTRKAVISCVTIDKAGRTSRPVTVLKPAHHVSYPFIFEVDGQIYLIPESSRTGRSTCIRNIRFPTDWMLDRTLIEQPGSDATLWQQAGTFWLFVNLSAAVSGRLCEDLHVFVADSLDGVWKAHPSNPVVVDASGARPAGRLFMDGDGVIRPAQDCSSGYGNGIVLRRVVKLSRTDYEEENVARIEPLPGTLGVHTINQSGEFEVMDVKVVRLKTVAQLASGIRRWARRHPRAAHTRRSEVVRHLSADRAGETSIPLRNASRPYPSVSK